MVAEVMNVRKVEKEELSSLKITTKDVLAGDEARQRLRSIYLTKAEKLGNSYKGKVKMYIGLEDGELISVETTIWHVDVDSISLKGGVHVPIKAIQEVEF